MDRYGEPAGVLAVMPPYFISTGRLCLWSSLTRFGESHYSDFRWSDRVERVLRRLLAARPRPRRRWYTVEITSS